MQLNGGLNLIFFSYTPTPTIGKSVTLYDATQTTTIGHLNMPERSIVYFCLWLNILLQLGFKHTVKLATPNRATFLRLLSEQSHWLTKVSKSYWSWTHFQGYKLWIEKKVQQLEIVNLNYRVTCTALLFGIMGATVS